MTRLTHLRLKSKRGVACNTPLYDYMFDEALRV